MKIFDVLSALRDPRWDKKKLEEASRGKVNGACDDPFKVEFKYWLEMARDRSKNRVEYFFADLGVVMQAILGIIK